jgi:DNA-binding GntR family transcriptional regulator
VKENSAQATVLGIEAGEPVIGLLRQRLVAGSPVIVNFALMPDQRRLALAAVETR